MTDQEKEIKRVISYIRSCRDAGIDTTITIDKTRNHFILNALEEIQQYRAIGTVEECREARERQIPKKPVKDEYNHDCCPNCGWVVYKEEWGGRYLPHCENCGQAISRESDTP